MENKRTHEELTEILDRNISWTENCDSKTSIILGSFGVITGIFLATDYVSKFLSIYRYMISHINFWTVIYLILCFSTIGLMIAGCVCWIFVLFARANPDGLSNKGIKSDSLIFFSSISKHKSLSSYKQKLKKCEKSQMEDDLISQIYICSIICDKKFKYYNLGLIFALIGAALFVVLILIGLYIV